MSHAVPTAPSGAAHWRRLLLVVTILLTAAVAAVASSPTPAQATPPAGADWLTTLNWYRQASGLSPVTEQPAWSAGIKAHLDYLRLTPASYRTGAYASAHTENPASPYYTPDGAAAGGASNIGYGSSGKNAIEGWMRAPFHAVNMLSPGLSQVAFYLDPVSGMAGLDVLRGSSGGTPASPILFPGNGSVVDLASGVGEAPNPLETCGYTPDSGLPLIAMLPSTPSSRLTAELVGPSGSLSSSGSDLCVVSQFTYRTSDPVYGPTGLGILQGSKAVFVIPRSTLDGGSYTVKLHQPGQSDIVWSFSIPGPPPPVPAGGTVKVHVSNTPNATVLGNLTVVDARQDGFTTAYPCVQGLPDASNNNYVAGQTIPNFAVVRSDANGDLCIRATGSAHLLWDQVAATTSVSTGNAERLLDTRRGAKPAARSITRVHVTNTPNATVFGNLTVVDAAADGYDTVFPCASGLPDSSNSNYAAGQTIPIFTVARADSAGDICIFTYSSAHLLWDQVGSTTALNASTPARLLDTRRSGRVQGGTIVIFGVTSTPGATVLGTLTVVNPSANGFTTAYPCGSDVPNASTNNYSAGRNIANFAAVKTDSQGRICVFTTATTDLIWDQVASTNVISSSTPARLLDTRQG